MKIERKQIINTHKNTAEHILDTAQDLIQRRGYNAISFNQIAEQVGIKKPSIIHHFPNKEALGKAVVERYRKMFAAGMDAISIAPDKSAMDAFNFYCKPYKDFGLEEDKICLCGSLAGEFMALPEDVQKEVNCFFESHINWLEDLVTRGRESGEFTFQGPVNRMAQLILDSLQGALIVKRATKSKEHLDSTITILKKLIKPS